MTDLPSNFEQLVGQAAGRMDPDWTAQRTESALVGLHRRRVRRAVFRGTVGAALLLCGVAWGAHRFGPGAGDTGPAVATATSSAADELTAAADSPVLSGDVAFDRGAVALSDGTRVVPLDRDADVVELTGERGRGVRARLVAGRSRFDRTGAKGTGPLELEAGNIRVHVFSSRFSAARYEAELELWVEEGFVEVTTAGDDGDGSARLRVDAGEHRTFALGAPAAALARPGEEDSGAARSAPTSDPTPAAQAMETARSASDPASNNEASRTADAMANGASKRPTEKAPERRVTRQPPARHADGSPADRAPADRVGSLLARADRERRSGRPAAAAAVLRRIVRDHDDDPRAALAGFTLGRVLLDDLGRAASAARAFDRARRLDPSGPLAEDALARAADAWFRAGEPDKARERAETYLARYPNGHRARAVRQYSTR